jgi:hypothetical protein
MLSRLGEQTLIGRKHIARQQLPDLAEREHASRTADGPNVRRRGPGRQEERKRCSLTSPTHHPPHYRPGAPVSLAVALSGGPSFSSQGIPMGAALLEDCLNFGVDGWAAAGACC